MPFQIGNKEGCKAGGGGRRSKRDEELRELAVQKAIGKYIKALRDLEGMNDKQYLRIKELCLPVVVKDLTNKIGNPDGSKIEQVLVKFLNNEDDRNSNRIQETV